MSVTISGQTGDIPLVLDTVVFAPDDDQVALTWRGRRLLGADLRRLTKLRVAEA